MTPEVPRPVTPPGQPVPPDNGTRYRELAALYGFLGNHPEIAEQLRKDPSLVDNKRWVDNHPEFREFLQAHPELAQQFRQDPRGFMEAEERYAQYEDHHDRWTTRQLAVMNQFLESHPEIAEQLRKDPSLVDNQQWVNSHPAFREFLQAHPEMAQEYRLDPRAFMMAEERYEHNENGGQDRDQKRAEMGRFGDFLRGHTTTADALSKDPTLANNRDFLESHPDLRDYLQTHPDLQQQMSTNPQAVMTSPELAYSTTSSPSKGETTSPTPSTKPDETMKPHSPE